MATPSAHTAATLPGNLRFSDGGMSVADLTGAVVKSATPSGDSTSLAIVFQDSTGAEITTTWTPPGGGAGISLEDARDAVGAIITSGAGISAVYDDAGDGGAGTITITALLSDTNPRSVTASANAPGTSVSAARRDHHHQVAAATTTQAGISELASNSEALAPSISTRAMTPASSHHLIDDRASDDDPEAPGTAAPGHVHGLRAVRPRPPRRHRGWRRPV